MDVAFKLLAIFLAVSGALTLIGLIEWIAVRLMPPRRRPMASFAARPDPRDSLAAFRRINRA